MKMNKRNIIYLILLLFLNSCETIPYIRLPKFTTIYSGVKTDNYGFYDGHNRFFGDKDPEYGRDYIGGPVVNCSNSEIICFDGLFKLVVDQKKINNEEMYQHGQHKFFPKCIYYSNNVCDMALIKFISNDTEFFPPDREGYFVFEKDFGVRTIARYDSELKFHIILNYNSGEPLLGPQFMSKWGLKSDIS